MTNISNSNLPSKAPNILGLHLVAVTEILNKFKKRIQRIR